LRETGSKNVENRTHNIIVSNVGKSIDMNQINSVIPDTDFGRYLASVTERDIDLLLLEEFHVNNDFVAWFCSELGLHNVTAAGAWHSLSDTDGESDLVLRVLQDERHIGILIENKVNAPAQHRQAERYHLRGKRLVEEGKLDSYRTVICAPQCYISAPLSENDYQHRILYEAIEAWFREQQGQGRRAVWRRYVMLAAIDQGRRGYTMAVNPAITKFHLAYWTYLRQRHPTIQMARPKNRGSKSTWIILKGINFPMGVKLHHKFDQQVMELGFEKHRVEEILAMKSDWPDDIHPVQKGETASLAIDIPAIDMTLDLDTQWPGVEKALESAYRLMPYASLFRHQV